MSGWDWAIWGVACYVAVFSLLRLMREHRAQRLRQLREDHRQERHRQTLLAAQPARRGTTPPARAG